MVTFEPLAERHLDRIMTIEAEAYPEPWTIGMFRQELQSNQSYFYVMLLQDELVGYGGFWLILDEAHITSVTVAAGQRRRGLGRDLLHYLLGQARDHQATMATLEVRERNEPARQLYVQEGFREVGLRKGYYPKSRENAVVMIKEL